MKKRELIKKIEDGFEELAPDVFEAVTEAGIKKNADCIGTEEREVLLWQQTGHAENGNQMTFSFGKSYGKWSLKAAFSVCVCLAAVCLCILFGIGEKEDTAYLVLDVNPSIQIEIDASCQVRNLEGLNGDGKEIVDVLEWKENEPVQKVLDGLLESMVEKAYLESGGAILVTLSAAKESFGDNLEREAKSGIGRRLKELDVADVTVAFCQTGTAFGAKGREFLEEQLAAQCDVTIDEVKEMTVGELISYCQEHTKTAVKISEESCGEKEEAGPKEKEPKTAPVQDTAEAAVEVPEEKSTEEEYVEEETEKKEDKDVKTNHAQSKVIETEETVTQTQTEVPVLQDTPAQTTQTEIPQQNPAVLSTEEENSKKKEQKREKKKKREKQGRENEKEKKQEKEKKNKDKEQQGKEQQGKENKNKERQNKDKEKKNKKEENEKNKKQTQNHTKDTEQKKKKQNQEKKENEKIQEQREKKEQEKKEQKKKDNARGE